MSILTPTQQSSKTIHYKLLKFLTVFHLTGAEKGLGKYLRPARRKGKWHGGEKVCKSAGTCGIYDQQSEDISEAEG
jgi:hypothetical protein